METQQEVRAAFWGTSKFVQVGGKSQNYYPADVRMAFVDFVDYLARDGQISESLASSVTL